MSGCSGRGWFRARHLAMMLPIATGQREPIRICNSGEPGTGRTKIALIFHLIFHLISLRLEGSGKEIR